MAFTKSSEVERYLTDIGVEFKYRSRVPFSRLSASWRTVNYGREKARDQDVVIEYAERLEGGSVAPAPIIHAIGDGQEILDGVQRLSASELIGETFFAAYEITVADPVLIHAIRIGANSRLNGHRPAPQFELTNAVRLLHIEDKLSAIDIARLIGQTVRKVQGEIARQRCEQHVRQAGNRGELKLNWLDTIAKYVPDHDLNHEPEAVNRLVTFWQQVNSKNGLATEMGEKIAGLKVKRGVNRVDQYKSVIDQFAKRPEIRGKLAGRTKDKIDNAIEKLRGASTAIKNAKKARHVIHDRAAINELKQLFQTIGYDINQMIEHDDPVFRVRTQA